MREARYRSPIDVLARAARPRKKYLVFFLSREYRCTAGDAEMFKALSSILEVERLLSRILEIGTSCLVPVCSSCTILCFDAGFVHTHIRTVLKISTVRPVGRGTAAWYASPVGGRWVLSTLRIFSCYACLSSPEMPPAERCPRCSPCRHRYTSPPPPEWHRHVQTGVRGEREGGRGG